MYWSSFAQHKFFFCGSSLLYISETYSFSSRCQVFHERGEKHPSAASCNVLARAGDWTHSLSSFPDREFDPKPVAAQGDASTLWANQKAVYLFACWRTLCHFQFFIAWCTSGCYECSRQDCEDIYFYFF